MFDLSPDEDNFPGRLLHQAALWDNSEFLEDLLNSEGGQKLIDAPDRNGRTPLHAAAITERSRCLRLLLNCGASVNAQGDEQSGAKTALHIAAEKGHSDNVRILLEAGASILLQDAAGRTPLQVAEREGHRHAALVLREARDAVERQRITSHNMLRRLLVAGEVTSMRLELSKLGSEAEIVVNMAPGGANTLLYVSSEMGLIEAAVALLASGADGRCHPVTKYSPLYTACYHGHAGIVRVLLAHFPQLAQQETVECWLPLHAACIGGHSSVVALLLKHTYPECLLTIYSDPTGKNSYKAAFDVNHKDVSGQTALYVASTLGNIQVMEILLDYTVEPLESTDSDSPPSDYEKEAVISPTRKRISQGIHNIMAKLSGQNENTQKNHCDQLIRPVNVNVQCGGDTCLAAAVRGGHHAAVAALLRAGADVNTTCSGSASTIGGGRADRVSRARSVSAPPRRSSQSPSPARGKNSEVIEGGWTPLALAAKARDHQATELLLRYGGTDVDGAATREAAANNDTALLARLLSIRAYVDSEYKLNKKAMTEAVFGADRNESTSLTFSSLYPSKPTMINWRDLHCGLNTISVKWLRQAVMHVNPKLNSSGTALHAITRLDVSNNHLRELPRALFSMVSLRYLNAAQNKLERLPKSSDPLEVEEHSRSEVRRRRGSKSSVREEHVYTAPVLEEVYLQDNRLEELESELFHLPSLSCLDVANNKLRSLPPDMWCSTSLKDINVAFNHLKDLPVLHQRSPGDQQSPGVLLSPTERSGLTPSQSVSQFAQSKVSSPSVEQSVPAFEFSNVRIDEEDCGPVLENRNGNAVWSRPRRYQPWWRHIESEGMSPLQSDVQHQQQQQQKTAATQSGLRSMNLSHNQLTHLPSPLACLAPQLTRLSLAYNSLRSMAYVTSYPNSLRQLDLSHNEITCWPSLPQIETILSSNPSPLACYCPGGQGGGCQSSKPGRPNSSGSFRSQVLSSVCPARRHLRLENLRTLILSNNLLTRIQLTTDDDGMMLTTTTVAANSMDSNTDEDDEWNVLPSVKSRLLFPNLSMLDVSCNMLKTVPSGIHELTSLSVLNISGNKDITELPPQMGLLSRLWNLNTNGCPLQEPLRTMIESKKYKTMDIVGYLKSVLEDAQPYARMKLMFVGLQDIGKTSLLECLRHETPSVYRRRQTDHWAKRMGNKTAGKIKGNISTVGVDIGTWTYERQRGPRGPVTFRTWDFGGQQEYYATHQYFLSRRSLYLVVWKLTDGKRGLSNAVKWLRSIQARAPGASVILVATHYDTAIQNGIADGETPESLQRMIRTRIMCACDADKLGLPKVLDSLEVSCTTKHNIRILADLIYDVAFSIKPPGSKEPILEQKVPASYLALEECVAHIAAERKSRGLEPVLRHDQYRQQVTHYMQSKGHKPFRDAAEFHQATMFLHENGVILHYDDATLKELYFLDPQWLCDMLAHVVTIREINPFARSGIMKLDDLQHVFKSSPLCGGGDDAKLLTVSLLNKFELALAWDGRTLLISPLLPHTSDKVNPIKLPLRVRHWMTSRGGVSAWAPSLSLLAPHATQKATGNDSPTLMDVSNCPVVWGRSTPERSLRRLLLLSYIPSGFWPRLITRILADETLAEVVHSAYIMPTEISLDSSTVKALEMTGSWQLCQTSVKLMYGDILLCSVREIPTFGSDDLFNCSVNDDNQSDGVDSYRGNRFKFLQDGVWCDLDVDSSCIVEILLPAEVMVIRRAVLDEMGQNIGYQNISVEATPEVVAKILAIVTDHVDLLLEDWYPSLGTRFVHTSEGRCLVTRVVPCPSCLHKPSKAVQPFHRAEQHVPAAAVQQQQHHVRVSQDSRTSDGGDSGVGPDSVSSSRMPSIECNAEQSVITAWSIEECILTACGGLDVTYTQAEAAKAMHCSVHGDVALADIAPDTLFLDFGDELLVRWDQVQKGRLLGRGSFGSVYACRCRGNNAAVKVLQPIPPTGGSSVIHAYKAARGRWQSGGAACAARAYGAARQEAAVLRAASHHHAVTLKGICASPIALLLDLAPLGALDGILRRYSACGVRVGRRTARSVALQAARALEHLHDKRILYRDLKAENVLVWSIPQPQDSAGAERSPETIKVHIKLGDYGISRFTLPSGAKGFGGTEGFMAPEIMKYNGEEEYTEKVDCFSFGMFLYEVMTLRQPFEGQEAVKETILEGGKPVLTPRDTWYGTCALECMWWCWSRAPEWRPSSAALVSITSAPEYVALQDHINLTTGTPQVTSAVATQIQVDGATCTECWIGVDNRIQLLLASQHGWTQQHTIKIKSDPSVSESARVTVLCAVGNTVWAGDSLGRVSCYCSSTCALLWRREVGASVCCGPSGAVSALCYLSIASRVAVAMEKGRLFLVSCESHLDSEESFVLTELGTAASLYSLTSVIKDNGVQELWCGGAEGIIWRYSMINIGPTHADSLPHDVKQPVTNMTNIGRRVYTYMAGGCIVYQWSVEESKVTVNLDCSKLVPCSESLKSISIDEHVTIDKCQVRSLVGVGDRLLIGTSWGCIIQVDADSLRPCTVFRPHEGDICAMVSTRDRNGDTALVTVGVGYRSLMQRFVELPAQMIHNTSSGVYCLLMTGNNWTAD